MPDDVAVGRQVRDLRVGKNLGQAEVASRAGVSRQVVSRLERGLIDGLTIAKLRSISKALEAPPIVTLGWRGPEFDRNRDRLHAAIVEAMCRHLRLHGWEVGPESGFSHYGERGSADILAWHPRAEVLLIVEIKTRLWDLQDLFSSTDRKRRLLPPEARRRFGWNPKSIGLLLVMPDLSTHRHTVARHASTFEAAFPARYREVRRWLSNPVNDLTGLTFLPIDQLQNIRQRELRIRARKRVRKGGRRRSRGQICPTRPDPASLGRPPPA